MFLLRKIINFIKSKRKDYIIKKRLERLAKKDPFIYN